MIHPKFRARLMDLHGADAREVESLLAEANEGNVAAIRAARPEHQPIRPGTMVAQTAALRPGDEVEVKVDGVEMGGMTIMADPSMPENEIDLVNPMTGERLRITNVKTTPGGPDTDEPPTR